MVRLAGGPSRFALLAVAAAIGVAGLIAWGVSGSGKAYQRDFVMPTKSLISASRRAPSPGETWLTSAPKFVCQAATDVGELSSVASHENDFGLLLSLKLFFNQCQRIESGSAVHVVSRDQSGLICVQRKDDTGACETTTPLDLSPLPL